MRRSLQIAAVLALALAPLFSLANSVAGRPICCWWMPSCPMSHADAAAGAMSSMPGMPDCRMTARCQTVIPAPPVMPLTSVPLFPPSAGRHLAITPGDRSRQSRLTAAALPGVSPSVFHVPLA